MMLQNQKRKKEAGQEEGIKTPFVLVFDGTILLLTLTLYLSKDSIIPND